MNWQEKSISPWMRGKIKAISAGIPGIRSPRCCRTELSQSRWASPSEPLRLQEQLFAIILVREKAAARELSEQALQIQRARLVDDWAAKEFQFYKITFHGFSNGWDSETDAWARWQMMRMKPEDEKEQ